MKKLFLLVLVSAMLLFGCVQLPGVSAPKGNLTIPSVPSVSGVVNQTLPPAQACSPSYTVTPPASAALSATGTMSVSANCAANKAVTVEVNGVQVASTAVPAGSSAVLNFNLVASPDGTNKVVVKGDGAEVYSGDWVVTPIGYFNTGGTDNDIISIKNWRAVSFDISNPITVNKAGAYLRALQTSTQAGSEIVAEIWSDSGGSPGSVVASSPLPLTKVTLTPNWLYFPMSAQLQPGRYWLVFRVDQPNSPLVSDSVNIQYYTVDKGKPGNANNLQMTLNRNDQARSWDKTSWVPLGYDRNYAFSISASG